MFTLTAYFKAFLTLLIPCLNLAFIALGGEFFCIIPHTSKHIYNKDYMNVVCYYCVAFWTD